MNQNSNFLHLHKILNSTLFSISIAVKAEKPQLKAIYASLGKEGLLVFRCREAFRNGVRKGKAARPNGQTGPAGHKANLKVANQLAPPPGDRNRLQRTTPV